MPQAFIDAGQQAGYPFTSDLNGAQQEGFGKMDMTIYRGRRWSTAFRSWSSASASLAIRCDTAWWPKT